MTWKKVITLMPEGHYSVELSQGAVALVSAEDIDRVAVLAWRLHNRGYAMAHDPEKPERHLLMHRFIAGTPRELEADHINGDRLDNRRENLRNVSRSENHMNTRRQARRTPGKTVGVRKHYLRWVAHLTKKGVGTLKARFDTQEEAIAQRQAWEREHFGSFAADEARRAAPAVPVVYPNKPRRPPATCPVCKRLFNGKRGPDGCCSTTCRERLRHRPVDG